MYGNPDGGNQNSCWFISLFHFPHIHFRSDSFGADTNSFWLLINLQPKLICLWLGFYCHSRKNTCGLSNDGLVHEVFRDSKSASPDILHEDICPHLKIKIWCNQINLMSYFAACFYPLTHHRSLDLVWRRGFTCGLSQCNTLQNKP